MTALSDIKPTERHRIYDLVRSAGIDVSDWAKLKGGKSKAAANPKYCYEWSFFRAKKLVVLNLWHAELDYHNGIISKGLNLRRRAFRIETVPNRKKRALNMDQYIQTAYVEGLSVRVILLEGRIRKSNDPDGKPSRATKRRLDPETWAVTEYD